MINFSSSFPSYIIIIGLFELHFFAVIDFVIMNFWRICDKKLRKYFGLTYKLILFGECVVENEFEKK